MNRKAWRQLKRPTVIILTAAMSALFANTVAAEEGCQAGQADSCHASIFQLPIQHPALKKLNCNSCHGRSDTPHPNGKGEEYKTKSDQSTICLAKCHDLTASLIQNSKSRHAPVEQGKCTACHKPHGGERPHLLVEEFPEPAAYIDKKPGLKLPLYAAYRKQNYDLCWQCHESTIVSEAADIAATQFRNGTKNLHYVHMMYGGKNSSYSCNHCHDAHASNQPALIIPPNDFRSWPPNFTQTSTGGQCNTFTCHRASIAYDRVEPVLNKKTIKAEGGGK